MATNLSKQKRESLLNKIEEIRTFINKNTEDVNSLKLNSYLNELIKEVNGKKYGLVFEEHQEEIDKILEANLPVLTEEKDLFIDNGGQVNFLIEGDNLASLKLLEKTHKGKVDLIYIDPPYNLGRSDFIYDDNYVDRNDLYKHSKWLSFMSKRLTISRELLSDSGLVFISIDDVELANLKIICDEIFGEINFISNSFVLDNLKGKANDNFITSVGSRLLIYCKKRDNRKEFVKIENLFADKVEKKYSKQDELGPFSEVTFKKTGQAKKRAERPFMYYPILEKNGKLFSITKEEFNRIYDKKTKIFDDNYVKSLKIKYKQFSFILPLDKNGDYLRWTSGFDTFNKKINDEIFWDKDVKQKVRPEANEMLQVYASGTPKSLMYKPAYSMGTMELEEIVPNNNFDFPKPVELIKDILRLEYEKNITILDFFAGSGTTGHAVLKLNEEDGGTRKFILCTNNENNICKDITYKRLKNVIENDKLPGSLKYYKVDFLPIEEKEYYEYADQLLLHVKELVELENAINFDGNKSLGIVLTDSDLEEICKEIENSNKIKTLYLGHDILLSAEKKKLFKSKNINIKIIPEYYYPELNG